MVLPARLVRRVIQLECVSGSSYHGQVTIYLKTDFAQFDACWVGLVSEASATMTTHVTPNYESRWLSKALQQVDELGSLTEFKAIAGVMPPNQVAIRKAKLVLAELAKVELCPSRISPSSDEGICISFSLTGKYADIECFNTGDIMAARSGASVETKISRVAAGEILKTVQKISEFLSEP